MPVEALLDMKNRREGKLHRFFGRTEKYSRQDQEACSYVKAGKEKGGTRRRRPTVGHQK